MSMNPNSIPDPAKPRVYQIRLEGHLSAQWSDWFEGLTVTLQDQGDTLLTGPLIDQAALYGLLRRVRDLGLTLISVVRLEADQTDSPVADP